MRYALFIAPGVLIFLGYYLHNLRRIRFKLLQLEARRADGILQYSYPVGGVVQPLVGGLLLLFVPATAKTRTRHRNLLRFLGDVFVAALIWRSAGAGRAVLVPKTTSDPRSEALPLGIDGIPAVVILTTPSGQISILIFVERIRLRKRILHTCSLFSSRHAGRFHGARFLPVLTCSGSNDSCNVFLIGVWGVFFDRGYTPRSNFSVYTLVVQ